MFFRVSDQNRLRQMTAACAVAAIAGIASATPRIVTIGGWPTAVTNSGVSFGSTGFLEPVATRWQVGANSVIKTTMPGSRSADFASEDGLFVTGTILNSLGLGGLPTDATITARWSSVPGWESLSLMTPAPAIGVTGSGSTYGSIHDPRDISSTGRFIVGQGYIEPNDSFLFRGWVWDAQANSGAGEMVVLPTSFDAGEGRYKDGRALAVSADGSVIVGGEAPNTGTGRAIVWRKNVGTGQYDATYLPTGLDGNGDPITSSIDSFHINDAGTIIVGMSYNYNVGLGFPESCLTRWTWNAGSQSWDRTILYNVDAGPQSLSSWWVQPEWCPLPPSLIPTGMSDDGQTIVGIITYSVCGSFVRGGFIWNNDDGGTLHDLYDYLAAQNTPGIESFASPYPEYPVPRLGWANDISPDGLHLVGVGGPFTTIGPGWQVDLNGGGCVAPFFNESPISTNFTACSTIFLNAAAGGSGPLTYQWYRDNVALTDGDSVTGSYITGSASDRLMIDRPKAGDAGSYTVVVTGPCGNLTSAAAQVLVDPNLASTTNTSCSTAQTVTQGVDVLTPAHNPCAVFAADGTTPSCAVPTGAALWYSFTPSTTGDYRIDSCGSTFDTMVTVYDGCGGNELACNDENLVGPAAQCSGNKGRVTSISLTANQNYRIRVAAGANAYLYDGAVTQLSITPAVVGPINDECATPEAVALGTTPFDTTAATADGYSWCAPDTSRDLWFAYSPATRQRLRVAACTGTAFDSVVSVHYGNCGWTLACSDDSGNAACPTGAIISSVVVNPGDPITIRVAGKTPDDFGAGQLTISVLCAADLDDGSATGTPDDGVDINDLLYFLAVFEAGSEAADLDDGSGTGTPDFGVDINDLLFFLIHFEAGC
jgi:hypothetical protein